MTNLILEKILAVQSEMPRLQKEGVGPDAQGKYKYLKIDDILEKLKPLLNQHGIIVRPVLKRRESEVRWAQEAMAPEQWSGRVPKVAVREVVEYDFIFTAVEDGSEFVATVSSEAMDSQDKASRKAVTSAWKICVIQVFQIITGEPDPDGEDGVASAQNDAPKQNRQEQMTGKARPAPGSAATKAPDAPAPQDEPIDVVKRDVRKAMGTYGLTLSQLDFIGDQVTGKPKETWFASAAQLRKVVKAIEDDATRTKLLATATTGEV